MRQMYHISTVPNGSCFISVSANEPKLGKLCSLMSFSCVETVPPILLDDSSWTVEAQTTNRLAAKTNQPK